MSSLDHQNSVQACRRPQKKRGWGRVLGAHLGSQLSLQLFVLNPALIAQGLGEGLSGEVVPYIGQVRRLPYREEESIHSSRPRLSIFVVTHTPVATPHPGSVCKPNKLVRFLRPNFVRLILNADEKFESQTKPKLTRRGQFQQNVKENPQDGQPVHLNCCLEEATGEEKGRKPYLCQAFASRQTKHKKRRKCRSLASLKTKTEN